MCWLEVIDVTKWLPQRIDNPPSLHPCTSPSTSLPNAAGHQHGGSRGRVQALLPVRDVCCRAGVSRCSPWTNLLQERSVVKTMNGPRDGHMVYMWLMQVVLCVYDGASRHIMCLYWYSWGTHVIYTEHQKKLITYSERHTLKSKAQKWIIIGHRWAIILLTKHISKNLCLL